MSPAHADQHLHLSSVAVVVVVVAIVEAVAS